MTGLTLRASVPALLGRNSIDQLFDAFFANPRPQIEKSTQGYPLTDIYRDEENNQVIEMALAGVAKEDITIEIHDNAITISHKGAPWRGEDVQPRRIARRSFTKTFIDYDNQLNLAKSTATFLNGLLKVTIPKVADKPAITIEIK